MLKKTQNKANVIEAVGSGFERIGEETQLLQSLPLGKMAHIALRKIEKIRK